MKSRITLTELERIMERSFNYEQIRRTAVIAYNLNVPNAERGISERCEIYLNPHRHLLITNSYDNGLEHYFDYDLIDKGLPLSQAIQYKKIFVEALLDLWIKKKFILYDYQV